MNASSRAARRIIAARRNASKAHRQGLHTLSSHARMAGIFDNDTSGVGGALRAKAKTLGVCGHTALMVRRTSAGVRPVKGAKRYTRDELAQLVFAYRPRVAKYALARRQLLAYVGA